MIDFNTRFQLQRSSIIQRISKDTTLSREGRFSISHGGKTSPNPFMSESSWILKNNKHLKKPASLENDIAYVNNFNNFESLFGGLTETKYQPQKL